MKGYRTIIVNVLALIFALVASYGFEISADNQASISAGVLAVANIVLRFMTNTEVGQSK